MKLVLLSLGFLAFVAIEAEARPRKYWHWLLVHPSHLNPHLENDREMFWLEDLKSVLLVLLDLLVSYFHTKCQDIYLKDTKTTTKIVSLPTESCSEGDFLKIMLVG